jgi:hypothetical protein
MSAIVKPRQEEGPAQPGLSTHEEEEEEAAAWRERSTRRFAPANIKDLS